jgi:hypothetical protein
MTVTHKIKNSKGKLVDVEMTRSKAIRYFCYECMGWQKSEVRNCTAPNCPLFPYRPLKIAPEVPQNATSVAQG